MANQIERPPSRADLNRRLVTNALGKEVNWIAFGALGVGGIVVGLPWAVALAIALVAYLVLAAGTYLDAEEAEKVGRRLREERGRRIAAGERSVDPRELAAPVAARLQAVLEQEARIRQAIEQAELPFAEVSVEVDGFVRAAERTAGRAELLYEYLAEQDREQIERRLAELKRAAAKPDAGTQALIDARSAQLAALGRMDRKLTDFYTEMERIAVELGNVRGQLLAVSATTEAAAQRELAEGVRGLREQLTAVAEGMNEVIDETGER